MRLGIAGRLEEAGVISVLVAEDVDQALKTAEVLLRAGLSAIEVTFRNQVAAEVIQTLVSRVPDAIIGAGTVLSVGDLIAARDAGASFAVAPGLNATVVEKALEIGLPFFPGVMTPTGIERGIGLGLEVLKFFPAETAGGTPMLKAVSAPYQHTGVKFIPTGGINPENLFSYLSVPTVLACGGTWIASPERIKNSDWMGIERDAREATRIVASARGNLSH